MRIAAPLAAALLSAAPALAQSTRWAIGHSYTSIGALRQPATLVALKSQGGPWLTKLDVGVLAGLPTGAGFNLELGLRVAAGSARTRAQRVFGAVARTDWSFPSPGIGMALGVEYEADGGFDESKVLAVAEVTPLGWGAAGLGRFTHRRRQADGTFVPLGLRWRPWLGGAAVTGGNFRGHGRIEAALRVPVASWVVEGDVEATSYYLDGFRGNNYAEAALSLEVGRSGMTLTLSAEEGRRPPRFEKASRASVGVGFRLPIARN